VGGCNGSKGGRNAARGGTLEHRPGAVRHHPHGSQDLALAIPYRSLRFGASATTAPSSIARHTFLARRRGHTQSLPFLLRSLRRTQRSCGIRPHSAALPNCTPHPSHTVAPATSTHRMQRQFARARSDPAPLLRRGRRPPLTWATVRLPDERDARGKRAQRSSSDAQSSSFLSPLVFPLGSKISSMRPYSLA
jgi:hypothetical protein